MDLWRLGFKFYYGKRILIFFFSLSANPLFLKHSLYSQNVALWGQNGKLRRLPSFSISFQTRSPLELGHFGLQLCLALGPLESYPYMCISGQPCTWRGFYGPKLPSPSVCILRPLQPIRLWLRVRVWLIRRPQEKTAVFQELPSSSFCLLFALLQCFQTAVSCILSTFHKTRGFCDYCKWKFYLLIFESKSYHLKSYHLVIVSSIQKVNY